VQETVITSLVPSISTIPKNCSLLRRSISSGIWWQTVKHYLRAKVLSSAFGPNVPEFRVRYKFPKVSKLSFIRVIVMGSSIVHVSREPDNVADILVMDRIEIRKQTQAPAPGRISPLAKASKAVEPSGTTSQSAYHWQLPSMWRLRLN